MTSYDKEKHLCIKCGEPSSNGILLSLVVSPSVNKKRNRKRSTRKTYWTVSKTGTKGTNKNPYKQ